jgi:FAD synthase/beta-phosphoglucomutase-like phosphatase (HAD superfamily)
MIRLNGIKNIIFDFGGVLIDLNQQACLDAFAKLGVPQVADYVTPYGHVGPFGQLENGDISVETFRDAFRQLFKVDLTDDQIDEAWGAFLMQIPANKLRMVHELAKTYRVFLLSNTSPIHIRKLQAFEEAGYPLNECFEKLYLSYEVGLSKPGKAIYKYVLKDAGLKPEETLFVDDGPANCASAAALGIRTYTPQPFEDFTNQLLRPQACVATMGFFDGVHQGHRFLIEETKRLAAEKGLPTLVLSFWPHPRTVLRADFYPQLLTDQGERAALLQTTGVDYLDVLDFDTDLAGMTAAQFMQTMLKDEWQVKTLVIGFDHRFGNSRTDDYEAYKAYGEAMGMEVVQVSPYYLSQVLEKSALEEGSAGPSDTADTAHNTHTLPPSNPQSQALLAHPASTTISSSLIRRLILAGEMDAAALALGRPYSLSGQVVGGHRIGNKLGYPTANIEPSSPNKLLPAIGIYAVWVDFEGTRYKGMLSIGRRPTLHTDSPVVIEVHLLHFSGNLYGKTLTLHFMKRFRQEEQFPDVEALVAKLKEDEQFVEAYLSVT